MSIRLKLDEGWNDLIREIEKAGGKIDKAVMVCQDKSAKVMQHELIDQMQRADVDSGLISRMPSPSIENDHGLVTARVGYKKGSYNPKELSDGYKAVFINYGTPRRRKHGKVEPRGFIIRAKNKARKKIKAEQENTFNEILKGLKQ